MFAKQPQPKNDFTGAKRSGKSPLLQRAGRVVVWGVAASLAGAVPVDAGLGYLPAIGPSPLRFQTPTVAFDRSSLPPLDLGDMPAQIAKVEEPAATAGPVPDPAKSESTVEPGGAAASVARTNQVPAVVQNPPTSTSTNQPMANPLPTFGSPDGKDPSVMSPQMLIHFFRPSNPGSTNRETSVIVPPSFTPPPPPSRSSTATFEKN